MPFTLVPYVKLRSAILKAIVDLIVRNKGQPDKEDIEHLEPLFDRYLSPERQIQARIFFRTIEKLDSSIDMPLESKNKILNALAYFVRFIIGDSYDSSWVPGMFSKRPGLFEKLTTALTIISVKSDPTKADQADLLGLYEPLISFLYAELYIDGQPRHGEHPSVFDAVRVTIKDYLKRLNTEFAELKNWEIDRPAAPAYYPAAAAGPAAAGPA